MISFRSMKGRVSTALLLVCALVAVPIVTSAANNNGVCESADVCLWKNADYLGPLLDRTGNLTDYSTTQYFNNAGNPNDETSSIWARGTGSWRVRVYQNKNAGGAFDCFDPNEITYQLPNSAFGGLANDSASSHYWSTTTC